MDAGGGVGVGVDGVDVEDGTNRAGQDFAAWRRGS